MKPLQYKFKSTGKIPNSEYPVLIYRNVFKERGEEGAH